MTLVPDGRQREILYLDAQGHAVVLGAAGSGKSTMAILRSHFLAIERPQSVVRLVTFNGALADYLAAMCPPGIDIRAQTIGQLLHPWISRRSTANRVYAPGMRPYIDAARSDFDVPDRLTVEQLSDELEWIMGFGVASAAEYREADRVGRGDVRVAGAERDAVFALHERVQQTMQADNVVPWAMCPTLALEAIAAEPPTAEFHVVIDEAQDQSPEAMRAAASIAANGSLLFLGDPTQRLYGSRFSYASVGLNIRYTQRIKTSYRTTHEIAQVASELRELWLGDDDETQAPEAPHRRGPRVLAARFDSAADEHEFIRKWAERASRGGSVAVLVPETTDTTVMRLGELGEEIPYRGASPAQPGSIFRGSYHRSKGMEFDAVVLPGLGASALPFTFDSHLGTERSKQRAASALVVAMTRAKNELILTTSAEWNDLVPVDSEHVDALEVGVWQEVVARGIRRVCHLTPVRNLSHILADGQIHPPAVLEADGLVLNPNDTARLDGRRDATSLSIQYPNVYYMDSVQRRQNGANDWCLIELDPLVLAWPGIEFSTANAAARHARIGRGEAAFRDLFGPEVVLGNGTRFPRGMTHDEAAPSDVQAEALAPRSIAASYITGVVFPSVENLERERRRLQVAIPYAELPTMTADPQMFDAAAIRLSAQGGV